MLLTNVVGMKHYKKHGVTLNVGDELTLMKEDGNQYDDEAIAVYKKGILVGYVANSPKTSWLGCHSAGNLIEKIGDIAKATVVVKSNAYTEDEIVIISV